MPTEREIEEKMWKALKSDRTIMLGLAGNPAHSQPMTAMFDDRADAPIWILSSKDVELVKAIRADEEAIAQFVSKGHDLFAALDGTIALVDDPAVVERLWNPFVAAWYPGGKADPKLQLLRFDVLHAHVWLNENSIFAGMKLLLGKDPKKEYQAQTADLSLPN